MSISTEAVLRNHFQAASRGVDAVMEDFTGASVLITHDRTYRGLTEIRRFFETLLDGAPEGFVDALTVERQEIEGEVAYIVWHAKPWLECATDTFVVRDGRIRVQTFTALPPDQ